MHKNGENAAKSLTNRIKAGNLNKKLNLPALSYLVIFMLGGAKNQGRALGNACFLHALPIIIS